MLVKTSTLTLSALDYAVAQALKVEVWIAHGNVYPHLVRTREGSGLFRNYNPSTAWKQGGPLIEEHCIELQLDTESSWFACVNNDERDTKALVFASGPKPLTAAMRCLVVSKLGDEVDIPEALVGK